MIYISVTCYKRVSTNAGSSLWTLRNWITWLSSQYWWKQDSNMGNLVLTSIFFSWHYAISPNQWKSITIYGNQVYLLLGILKIYNFYKYSFQVPNIMLILTGKFIKQSYNSLLWKYFHIYKDLEHVSMRQILSEHLLCTWHCSCC